MRQQTALSGPGIYAVAQRKAKYGHCDWIVWVGKDGIKQARKLNSPTAMKECLLAQGTQGRWSLLSGSTGCSFLGFWAMGINIINQFKHGMRH